MKQLYLVCNNEGLHLQTHENSHEPHPSEDVSNSSTAWAKLSTILSGRMAGCSSSEGLIGGKAGSMTYTVD